MKVKDAIYFYEKIVLKPKIICKNTYIYQRDSYELFAISRIFGVHERIINKYYITLNSMYEVSL